MLVESINTLRWKLPGEGIRLVGAEFLCKEGVVATLD
jgi:hypothetical protein